MSRLSGLESTYKELKLTQDRSQQKPIHCLESTYKELKLFFVFTVFANVKSLESTYKELKLCYRPACFIIDFV